MATEQSAGRGRQGREWRSGAGNFHGSALVLLRDDDPPASSLSLACGLALIEAIDAVAGGLPLMLKWPNDLLLGGAKLAGILLERSGDRLVAGFGVNLAIAPAIEGRPVASLAGHSAICSQSFAPLLAASFARRLARWREEPTAALEADWLARAHPAGSRLSVHSSAEERLAGTFDGLAPGGALRLRLADGSVRVMHAGDVTLG